jgi:hypothetical protein
MLNDEALLVLNNEARTELIQSVGWHAYEKVRISCDVAMLHRFKQELHPNSFIVSSSPKMCLLASLRLEGDCSCSKLALSKDIGPSGLEERMRFNIILNNEPQQLPGLESSTTSKGSIFHFSIKRIQSYVKQKLSANASFCLNQRVNLYKLTQDGRGGETKDRVRRRKGRRC